MPKRLALFFLGVYIFIIGMLFTVYGCSPKTEGEFQTQITAEVTKIQESSCCKSIFISYKLGNYPVVDELKLDDAIFYYIIKKNKGDLKLTAKYYTRTGGG